MSGRAIRSRLLDLRQARDAAQRGRDVLEQKLGLVRREWERRRALRDRAASVAETKLASAREALRQARLDAGRCAVDSAALAQPRAAPVEWKWERVAGVRVPALSSPARPFRALYGAAGTSAALDAAGAAFTEALASLVAFASHDAAVKALRRATLRTLRRVNALDQTVLPQIRRELREIAAALEEDEREESSRRKAWLRLRST